MWFDKFRKTNIDMTYDVHNESSKYDEEYSEKSSEFMVSPSFVGDNLNLSHAQVSILSAIFNKLKSRSFAGDYNDCSYPEVYDQD